MIVKAEHLKDIKKGSKIDFVHPTLKTKEGKPVEISVFRESFFDKKLGKELYYNGLTVIDNLIDMNNTHFVNEENLELIANGINRLAKCKSIEEFNYIRSLNKHKVYEGDCVNIGYININIVGIIPFFEDTEKDGKMKYHLLNSRGEKSKELRTVHFGMNIKKVIQ